MSLERSSVRDRNCSSSSVRPRVSSRPRPYMRPAKWRYSSPVSRSYNGSSSGSTPMRRLMPSRSVSSGRPSIITSPAVGRSRPVSILIVVLLPAPLGPRKPKKRPRATLKVSPSTAVFSRKTLVRPRTTIASGVTSDIGRSISHYPRTVLIDRFLPEYDWNELHSIEIGAAPAAVLAAVRAVTAEEIRLLGPLLWLRGLPARLLGHRPRVRGGGPVLEAVLRSTFVLLAENESEMVVGTVGRFWQPRATHAEIGDGDAFIAFETPGWAKAAMRSEERRVGKECRSR